MTPAEATAPGRATRGSSHPSEAAPVIVRTGQTRHVPATTRTTTTAPEATTAAGGAVVAGPQVAAAPAPAVDQAGAVDTVLRSSAGKAAPVDTVDVAAASLVTPADDPTSRALTLALLLTGGVLVGRHLLRTAGRPATGTRSRD